MQINDLMKNLVKTWSYLIVAFGASSLFEISCASSDLGATASIGDRACTFATDKLQLYFTAVHSLYRSSLARLTRGRMTVVFDETVRNDVIMQSRATFVHKVATRIINFTWRAQIRRQVRRLPKVSRYSTPSAGRSATRKLLLFFSSVL